MKLNLKEISINFIFAILGGYIGAIVSFYADNPFSREVFGSIISVSIVPGILILLIGKIKKV